MVTDSAAFIGSVKTASKKPFWQDVIHFVTAAWDAVIDKNQTSFTLCGVLKALGVICPCACMCATIRHHLSTCMYVFTMQIHVCYVRNCSVFL